MPPCAPVMSTCVWFQKFPLFLKVRLCCFLTLSLPEIFLKSEYVRQLNRFFTCLANVFETGKNGCLPHIRERVKQQGFAVIVVAEGAGEELLGESAETDASGNKKLPAIGEFLKAAVVDYFKERGDEATVK